METRKPDDLINVKGAIPTSAGQVMVMLNLCEGERLRLISSPVTPKYELQKEGEMYSETDMLFVENDICEPGLPTPGAYRPHEAPEDKTPSLAAREKSVAQREQAVANREAELHLRFDLLAIKEEEYRKDLRHLLERKFLQEQLEKVDNRIESNINMRAEGLVLIQEQNITLNRRIIELTAELDALKSQSPKSPKNSNIALSFLHFFDRHKTCPPNVSDTLKSLKPGRQNSE
jgi:hypothetical protein